MTDADNLDDYYCINTCECGREYKAAKHMVFGGVYGGSHPKAGQTYGPHPWYIKCSRCRNLRQLGFTDSDGIVQEYTPVGKGWMPLVLELHKKLENIYPEYEISQIKEKFGTLRYYVGSMTKEGYALIDAAEAESAKTCEECGHPGKLRKGGWLKTLCDGCAYTRGTMEVLEYDDND